jgi:hypothetical protein
MEKTRYGMDKDIIARQTQVGYWHKTIKGRNTMMGDFVQWMFGMIIFILDIVAIVDIVGSSKSIGMKALWIILILFLPVLGLILYALFGRERRAMV